MRRLQDLRVGQRLTAAFGLMALLLLAVVGVSLKGNASQRQTGRALVDHQRAVEAILQVKFRAADFNGWQTAYAFDAIRRVEGALDDSKGTRKAFLDSTAAFRTELAALDAQAELKGSRADTEVISRSFDRFMALDGRIVSLYRSGRAVDAATATGLVLGEELTLFGSIDKAAARIDTSIRQRTRAQEKQAERVGVRNRDAVMTVAVLALLLAVLLAFFITRSLTAPLSRSVGLLRRVAGGDLTGRVKDPTGDELGQMSVALNDSLEQMSETVHGIAQGSERLSSASEELSAVSQQMSAAAEETAVQASSVSVAAEQVSSNVLSVSAGAEQLGASITEIAQSATEAAQVAAQAVLVAGHANDTVVKLGVSSQEIGEVVKVITSIAEQTNLLALNATIEAARAGEVGKGFAVVASEVKDLARKTGTSSEEIGRKISTIQADTRDAVEAIGQITGIVQRINDIQMVIAAAVEEQAATTNEIGRSVTEAAAGAGEIARNITGVADTARGTTQGATETHRAAEELSRLAGELLGMVGRFDVGARETATASSGAK